MSRRRPSLPATDLTAHAGWLEPHFTIQKPPGPGPFPVCLQFHGCGGILDMQFQYARAARQAGFAVVVVDSFGPRGVSRASALTTICTGARFRGAERTLDVLAALDWASRQPWADPDRIALAGWSHGAWAAMEALTGPARNWQAARLPVKAAILFYPYCGPLSHTASWGWGENRPAVHACLGGRDVVVGTAAPRRALRRLEADGLKVRSLLLEEAAHCFDEDAPEAPSSRFRPDLAEIARNFYVEALSESLASQPSRPVRHLRGETKRREQCFG
ncbi:MAG TPA: prolyl oligopeptidase family serine peptidase [Caulobacteraceae bacterium]|jgi:dienelactone hydrolase